MNRRAFIVSLLCLPAAVQSAPAGYGVLKVARVDDIIYIPPPDDGYVHGIRRTGTMTFTMNWAPNDQP